MKKVISFFLILCLLSSVITFTVSAEEENFIPESDSTFESGNFTWKTLGGGLLKIDNNPVGEGKVLCYSGIPDQSYASPMIDVRPYVTEKITEETTLYVSLDIYTKSDDLLAVLVRLRTSTPAGYSKCTEADKNYCTIGTIDAYSEEWSRVSFSFDVTEEDLQSTEPWNICFDGLSSHTRENIYFDNFYIGTEEECPLEENEDNGLSEDTNADAVNFLSEANSTFESGTPAWKILGAGAVSIVANPKGEGNVLCYADLDTSKNYSSPQLDVRSSIQKNISEEVTIYGAIDVYCEKEIPNTLIRLRTSTSEGFSQCAADDKNYCTIGNGSATAGAWSTMEFSFTVYEEDLEVKEPWNICFDGIIKNLSAEDKVYIDNVYVGTIRPEANEEEDKPIPEKTPVSRFDNTLVGTIRWDAFTKSTPDGMDPASQVARVLSPAKYHAQAPFFSLVNDDGTIAFPEYTVETWEKEAEYAVNGGLDYFAYLWYETTDAMSQPRKLHLQSEKKDIIKLCGILESPRSKKSMDELFDAMKDSCYLTLDGRPVLFIYGIGEKDTKWTKGAIETIRRNAANAGIEKALYIVGMHFSDNLDAFNKSVGLDIDAISWYSVSSLKTAEPFADLASRCEKTMANMGGLALAYNIDIIPAFTSGRDTRARIETGVTWVDGDPNATEDRDKPYLNRYTLEPSTEELENHMYNVINYANTAINAKTNMVLSYGWNEHEEGGWLCPTITVDENGNPIYNEDGTIKANTERLDALKRAKERALNALEATPEATAPTDTEIVPDVTPTNENSFNILDYWWILPIVAVVIGAVVTVIVISKKKKSE